jgi:hypothetical protein
MEEESGSQRTIIEGMGAGSMAQVVEHLPHNCESLSSNTSTVKKKKKKEDEVVQSTLYTSMELSQ